MEYDVFISCKSEDYKYAENIYKFLNSNGFNIFLAFEQLRKLGTSEYTKAISEALNSTTHMIVFASKPEHINSSWVEYEWRTFIAASLNQVKRG